MFLAGCPSLLSISVTKYHVQKQLRKKMGWICLHILIIVSYRGKSKDELRLGTCRQELKQKQWRTLLTSLLPKTFLACPSIQSRTTCSRVTPAIVGFSLPHFNQENALQMCLQASMIEVFPQPSVSLPRWLESVSSWTKTKQHIHYLFARVKHRLHFIIQKHA